MEWQTVPKQSDDCGEERLALFSSWLDNNLKLE